METKTKTKQRGSFRQLQKYVGGLFEKASRHRFNDETIAPLFFAALAVGCENFGHQILLIIKQLVQGDILTIWETDL